MSCAAFSAESAVAKALCGVRLFWRKPRWRVVHFEWGHVVFRSGVLPATDALEAALLAHAARAASDPRYDLLGKASPALVCSVERLRLLPRKLPNAPELADLKLSVE